MMYARNQLSRFRSFASRSNFSIVRLSTMPVEYMMLPQMVDLPASTWPMNTTLMFSRGSSFAISSSRDSEVV